MLRRHVFGGPRYVQPAQPGKWPGSLPEALLPGAHPDKLRVYKDFQTVQRLQIPLDDLFPERNYF